MILKAYDASVRGGGISPWISENEIDLHGCSVAMAVVTTEYVLQQLWLRNQASPLSAIASNDVASYSIIDQTTFSGPPVASWDGDVPETVHMNVSFEHVAPRHLLIVTGQGKGSSRHIPLVQQALLQRLCHSAILPDNRGRISVDLAKEFQMRTKKRERVQPRAIQTDSVPR